MRKAIMKLHITSSEIFALVFLLNQNLDSKIVSDNKKF